MKTALFYTLFFPFAGAFFLALAGSRIPRKVVEIIACSTIGASFLLTFSAWLISGGKPQTITLYEWIRAGDFAASVDLFYDPLAAVMAVMVTFVAFLIHIYSIGYMKKEEGYVRYYFFMNLFVFSMLVIVLADSLVFFFLGWEGVGFCSYGLIGFWYRDIQNTIAGRKAFLLTRIGDVAFGVAIGLFFIYLDNFSISRISVQAGAIPLSAATLLGCLLLWSAAGKSAQLPLSVWLPDAMAGPTPVSALIHAATMVTAGVYLLMRLFPVIALSSAALTLIAVIGGITAFLAAWSALAQTDIKRILAYSTISQVGYMMLGIGASEVASSMHLLLSHAFYKSLLFLAAGIIIHSLHGEQNIYRMGEGLRKHIPPIFWLFLAGALSLGAIPPFGGFFAKDQILVSVFSIPGLLHKFIGAMAAATVFLTSLYTFRLFFILYFKESKNEDFGVPVKNSQSTPGSMVYVLWPLAALSLLAGAINFPSRAGRWLTNFLNKGFYPGDIDYHTVDYAFLLEMLDVFLAVGGAGLAFLLFGSKRFVKWQSFQMLSDKFGEMCKTGFYLDNLYVAAIVRPFDKAARFLWKNVDTDYIDGAARGIGHLLASLSTVIRFWTTGRLSTYLGMLLWGFTAILCVMFLAMFI